MFPYFRSALQSFRRWFTPPRRRTIRNARPRARLHVERLEDRTLLAASVSSSVSSNVLTVVLTDATTDTATVLIQRKSAVSTQADFSNLEIKLNGASQGSFAMSSFGAIKLQAGAGTDTLKVDQTNGALNVPVTFLAGTGAATFIDTAAILNGVKSSGQFVLGDQLNTQLNNLQTLIDDNVYNQLLPIVATAGSNALEDVDQSDVMGTFSTRIQKALNNTSTSNPSGLASSAGPADIQKALFVALGPSGANMLQDRPTDANTTIDINDIVVVATSGAFSYQMNLVNQNQTYDNDTLLDFDHGMAGLPLRLSGQSDQAVQTQFGFRYDLKFNIASGAAASIDNATTSTSPLLIDLNARLAPGYEDTGATFGLLDADISDGPKLRVLSWGDGSGVPTSGKNLVIVGLDSSSVLHIRIFDAAGVRVTDTDSSKLPSTAAITNLTQQLADLLPPHVLTLAEKAQVLAAVGGITGKDLSTTTKLAAQYQVTFGGSGNSSTVSATVYGAANYGLHVDLSVKPNQVGPESLTGGANTTGDTINLKYLSDMTANWSFGTVTTPVALGPLASLGSKPTVSFAVSMDPNSFFHNFVRTIVQDDIRPAFQDVQALADALNYRITLGFSLADLFSNPVLHPLGNFAGFLEAISRFRVIAEDLASLPAINGSVDLGRFSISQDARVKTHGPSSNDYVSIQPGDATAPAVAPLTQMYNMVNDQAHFVRFDVKGTQRGNFFDLIKHSVTFGGIQVGGGFEVFKTVVFNLLKFPMLESPVNTFNLFMNHRQTLLTWDTPPVALGLTTSFVIHEDEMNTELRLIPQVKFLGHFAGGFDTYGLEIGVPNEGYYMTRADPAESNIPDIGTVVDQFSPNYNFHSTFMRLTVHFGVDAGFTLSKVLEADSELKNILSKIGVDFSLAAGITLGGDIYWKPYEPDAAALPDGLETPFVDPATITREQFEQQVLRASEFLDDYQHCGSIWGKSGDLSFGFNFFLKITVFWVPIVNLVLDLATFKIADFNTGECEGLGAPPLAHLGDPNNNVAGPYAAALGLKEVAGTLYVHTATARPANSDDKSQDDTVLISAIATNADGTNDLRVTAQGRTQEFKNVKAIYADGGEGNDSFIVDSTVTIPAEIHDGDGNNHLEYNGSGSASLSTGNGTNSLIGGAGANTLVSGNGNSSIKAAGPGTTSITVGNGDNQIRGGSGVQTILVGNGNNQIQFGAGNSTITLGAGANTIIGGIKGGHVKIIDSTSTDTDHTGKGLVDQLILNGTANPDTVTFATGTLNGLAAVRIDDGTATSTWSVTALNPNAISFLGGGNNGATGRDGSRITVDDLSSTGVATVNINPNLGLILNRQKDAFTVLGTTHADNVFIDAATNQAGVTLGVAVTGLGYTVNLTGMEPAYDTLTLQGNGGNDLFTVGNNSPRTNVTSAGYARVENAFSSFTIQGAAGSSSQVVVSDDADFTLTDTSVTRSTGGAITLHNIAKVILTGGAGANRFTVLNWSGDADLDAMGNIDTLQADWTQDFNGNLNLLGFENAAITVGRDFNGRVSSSQPGTIQQVTIGRALTSTGQLTAGSIDRMTIGPDAFTPGADMAGRIIVAGTLGDLRVAGGTPGTIVAGRVGTVRAYGGYGPVVLQINEAGIQRRVEAATQGMDYPTATASVSPGGVTVQYYYESGSLAHPQLTARVSNSNPSVNPFDLSLVTYHDAAKFNLARLDAAGIAGIRNVAIEGDLRKAVTAGAAGFFKVPTTTPGGVRLGLDALAGVAVRDYAPNGYIQAKSIQAVAFGSHTRSDGKLETGAVAQAVEAARLLAAGTAIVQANNTYRVSFADLPAQQVGFFLATEPRGGKFDSQNIALVVQALTTANAALTANIVTPQNVARGAAIALIKAVPTFDKAGKALNSVVQTIDIRGDGASVVSGLPIAGGITSTGPLGDLNFKSGPIASLTAPSIFGSIGNGPITGIIQTTGLRTDPITGVITSIPADLGRVYVTATTKGPIAVASTMTSNAGFFGQLLVRGNLISQVQAGAGLSGVIAIQGNIATTTAKDIEGRTVRLGGLVVNGSISGQIVTLENVYADVIVNGGLTGGRIAVKGDILGNFIINGILDTTSAVVAGGKIGDAAVGTALKIGEVKGILAAEGSIIFNQTPNTKQAAFFGSNLKTLDAISAAAIDRIFMNNGAPLDFGLDLNGLGLILNKLAALRVIKGKLA